MKSIMRKLQKEVNKVLIAEKMRECLANRPN